MCHAAGVVDTKPLSASNFKSVQATLDVNLIAGLEVARVVCRRDVLEEEGGSLLFIASIYGLIGMPGETAYSASKGAVLAAVRTLAVELARRKIRVNALSPGFVKTAMTENALSRLSAEHAEKIKSAHPLGVGEPEDVARAASFLLAPVNAWITGSNLVIDGGFTAQ
jgi:NAD(P)-dependent dehydrogenase (short-subunit alcohol dehydrogenase family)